MFSSSSFQTYDEVSNPVIQKTIIIISLLLFTFFPIHHVFHYVAHPQSNPLVSSSSSSMPDFVGASTFEARGACLACLVRPRASTLGTHTYKVSRCCLNVMLKLRFPPPFSPSPPPPPSTPKKPLTLSPFQRNPPIRPHLTVLVMHSCHFSTLELFGLPYPADMTETDLFSSPEPLEPDHTAGLPV